MRHRFLFPLSLSLAAAFVVAGCGQDTTAPTPSAASTLADGAGGGLSANAGNPVVFLARGSMHKEGAFVGNPGVEGWATFTFTAEQRQDGTTTGQMLFDRKGGTNQHGRVFCMTRIANSDIALIGAEGTIRRSDTDPANGVGLPQPDVANGNHGIIFAVRDNGEGANAPPDQFTGMLHTLEQVAAAACANPQDVFGPRPDLVAEAFFNDADAGNVQVAFP